MIFEHDLNDMCVLIFLGWLIHHRDKQNLCKTVVTYLPPINAKVTEFSTIFTYLEYIHNLARQANMKYVDESLDCGVTIIAYKTRWQYQRKFENVIIYFGDFHFMKENFQVLYVVGLLEKYYPRSKNVNVQG